MQTLGPFPLATTLLMRRWDGRPAASQKAGVGGRVGRVDRPPQAGRLLPQFRTRGLLWQQPSRLLVGRVDDLRRLKPRRCQLTLPPPLFLRPVSGWKGEGPSCILAAGRDCYHLIVVNIYIVAILKIIVLEALAGVVLVSYLFGEAGRRRWFRVAFATVALASILGYFNFGHFRFEGGVANDRDHFHFFLGSKYLPEVGYDNLYRATAIALDDSHKEITRQGLFLRDLLSFEMEDVRQHLVHPDFVTNRFSRDRWRAFSRDILFFVDDVGIPVEGVLQDHGNTGSPAWASVARVFTSRVAASLAVLNVLSFLDVGLLILLFVMIRRAFGYHTMVITLVVTMLVPRAYDFLGGSLLRLDWLFALGMAACFLKLRRPKTTGVFLAYAIASKPFCALFALSLGCKLLIDTVRSRRIRRWRVELVVASVVALVVIFVVSSIVLGGFGTWDQYVERILITLHEKHYNDNYSFRDVFLQVTTDGPRALFDWMPWPKAAAHQNIFIERFAVSFALARAAMLALLVFVISRHKDDAFALGMGAFFVYVVFVTNMYYWQMLLLPTLAFAAGYRKDPRRLLFLLFTCVFLMASYVAVHWPSVSGLEGYFGSYWLLLFCLFLFVVEVVFALKTRRSPGAPTPSSPVSC